MLLQSRSDQTKFMQLKWYYDQKISSFFSSDFERVFAYHLTGKILSFEFYPKTVYFECKFWILRSAITHIRVRGAMHSGKMSQFTLVKYSAFW